MAALDCLTRAGLSGLLDCSSQAVKQNCPQPRSPEGLRCPVLTPRERLLSASALWWCLWVMSASVYEKQQVQKQSTHWCAGRDWWGQTIVGPLGAEAPLEGHRLLSRASGSLPHP